MSVRDIIQSATSSSSAGTQTYVDDVFSTYLYTGNGSTQTITNGIDLAGKGGLVWVKGRTTSYVHTLYSTDIGANKYMSTTSTGGFYDQSPYGLSFNSNGFSVTDETTGIYGVNGSTGSFGGTYASWTFRKAAKFFDTTTVVHTTGASSNVPLPTNYADVGFSIVKNTSTTGDWYAFHRSLGQWDGMRLNSTAAASGLITEMVCFTPGNIGIPASAPSGTYVGYFFYHNTAADGMIQCGSYTVPGGGVSTINLGWEPQYLLVKNSSAVSSWNIADNMRGMPVSGNTARLIPNLSNAEINSGLYLTPTATGFVDQGLGSPGDTFIYMAIRRPTKPPTTGTQVFTSAYGNNLGASGLIYNSSHIVDLLIGKDLSSGTTSYFQDRLRGAAQYIGSAEATGELTSSAWSLDTNQGVNYTTARDLRDRIGFMFKRAPGFLDIVCWVGNSTNRSLNHNLGVEPELILCLARTTGNNHLAYAKPLGAPSPHSHYVYINDTGSSGYFDLWYADATSTQFSVSSDIQVNYTGRNYVAYLFASLAGVSKVGSYTGNGTSQTINCGFAAGARFVLIKRDAVGDWYIWDTTRGITVNNDSHISLNIATTQVTTDDSIDPDNTGFIVNQVAATDINVTSATYIFLAIS